MKGEVVGSEFAANVHFSEPMDRVFEMACRPGGGNGWWTTAGDVVTTVGQEFQLNWSDIDFIRFRVATFERPRAMRWVCIEQQDSNLHPPDEWVGTELDFELHGDPKGTTLRFVHHGLEPGLECFDVCRRGWEFFLRRSLRRLVETGKGLPYAV